MLEFAPCEFKFTLEFTPCEFKFVLEFTLEFAFKFAIKFALCEFKFEFKEFFEFWLKNSKFSSKISVFFKFAPKFVRLARDKNACKKLAHLLKLPFYKAFRLKIQKAFIHAHTS